jgi:nucleoside-diphosphate-sugar epimerase
VYTVLGGSGFIGSRLAAHLRAQGLHCEVPARHDASVFTRALGHAVYAIGLTSDFRARPLDTVEAHVCLLRQLLASGNFESLTYLSSTRVYAGGSDTSETASLRVNPNDASDVYNLSKLMGESLCLHGGRHNVKVARLSNIVGVRATPDSFLEQLLREGLSTGKLELHTSLASRKDYLYVDDAVDLLARLAASEHSGIFNVAGGVGTANAQIAQALAEQAKIQVSVNPAAPDWDFQDISIRKVQQHFPFSPQPFSEFFPRFLAAYPRASQGPY